MKYKLLLNAVIFIAFFAKAQINLLKDINPGVSSSITSGPVSIKSTVYFTATDGVSGTELWKTNGTAAGTVMIKDINPGAGSSAPFLLTFYNNKVNNSNLYFVAYNGIGYAIYSSNGTAAGTVPVTAVNFFFGPAVTSQCAFTVLNGFLYYCDGKQIIKIDGTNVTITPTSTAIVPGSMTASGTKFYFKDYVPLAPNPGYQTTLYCTDITTGVVTLLQYPDVSRRHQDFRDVNGVLYFLNKHISPSPPNRKDILYKTDGTIAGTKAITSSPGLNYYQNSAVLNGAFYFSGTDTAGGLYIKGLWKATGTGVTLIKQFTGIGTVKTAGNSLYFTAKDNNNITALFKSDGTDAGTVYIKTYNSTSFTEVNNFVFFNNAVFFDADNGVNGRELWKTDGTAPGTYLLQDKVPGATSFSPLNLCAADNGLFMTGTEAATGTEPYFLPIASSLAIAQSVDEEKLTKPELNTQKDFIMYPLPVTNILNIYSERNIKSVSLYTEAGKLIKKMDLTAGHQQLDVSSFSTGIYFLKTKNLPAQKIIVQH